jgi:DNA polymerase III subunit delta
MPAPAESSGSDVGGQQYHGVVLVLGDEAFLVGRAIEQIAAAGRRADPEAEMVERDGADVVPGELFELLSPSLFGSGRTVVVRSAQDVPAAAVPALTGFFADPGDDITLVIQHAGGARGRNLLEAARSAASVVITCAKLARPGEREDFVRAEMRRHRARITSEAVARLIDAVGTDLRELAGVCDQLASDSGGRVDVDVVSAYHRGRAQVSGFVVSDHAVVGDVAGAMENLRWALSVGVPPVLIADALADGVRSIAKVTGIGRGSPNVLASRLGMPSWKVQRVQRQATGWSEPGLARAMIVVADLNADVKGVAVDPEYALERAVRTLAEARAIRR